MDDESTHDWLKRELAVGEQDKAHVGAARAERILQRRTNVHDWVMIMFMVVAVVTGTVVVVYGHHADKRATAAGARAKTTNSAVIEALGAQQRSSDAIATLADDFAVLVAAKTDAERDAALQKLLTDKQLAQDAKRVADLELGDLSNPSPATTTTTRSRGQSSSPSSPAPTTSTTRSPTTSTTSTSTTSTTTAVSSVCRIVACPGPVPLLR